MFENARVRMNAVLNYFLSEDGKKLKKKLPAISIQVGQELAEQSDEINYHSLITQLSQLNNIMKNMKREP